MATAPVGARLRFSTATRGLSLRRPRDRQVKVPLACEHTRARTVHFCSRYVDRPGVNVEKFCRVEFLSISRPLGGAGLPGERLDALGVPPVAGRESDFVGVARGRDLLRSALS